jgi:hypothetical protein
MDFFSKPKTTLLATATEDELLKAGKKCRIYSASLLATATEDELLLEAGNDAYTKHVIASTAK